MNNTQQTSKKIFPAIVILLSSVGLLSAVWQLGQKLYYLENPGAPLSCNLSPIMDCGKILEHPLSSVFGVPNAMLGMIFFTVMLTIGVLLALGVVATKAMRLLLSGFVSGTLLFTGWFYAVSLYDIGKICVFCIAIWSAIVPLFFLTIREYHKDFTFLPKPLRVFVESINRYPYHFIAGTYLVMIALFLLQFRDYYFG